MDAGLESLRKLTRGELRGRIAQLALMAAYRASWPVMQRLVPLMAKLVQDGGIDELRPIVVYMAATTREPERSLSSKPPIRVPIGSSAEASIFMVASRSMVLRSFCSNRGRYSSSK